MREILELADIKLSSILGYSVPLYIADDDFVEYMEEQGLLEDSVDIADFIDAWEGFLRDECVILK